MRFHKLNLFCEAGDSDYIHTDDVGPEPTGAVAQRVVHTGAAEWRERGAMGSNPVAIVIILPLSPETHALLKSTGQLLLI